jgi:hypothetical protein
MNGTVMDTPPQAAAARPRSMNPWLIVGVVLAVPAILSTALSIGAVIGRHSDTVTRQVAAGPRLVVRVNSGDVHVTGGDGRTIEITARRSWAYAEPHLSTSRNGDTVEVRVDCGWSVSGWCTADLELRVPAATELVVDGDSGDLSAGGLLRPVRLSSDSGSVTARDIIGDVTLDTDSGRVEANDVRGNLVLATDSGDVEVGRGAGDRVSAHTDSGSVRIDLVADAGTVDASTDSGRVDVRLPNTSGVAYLLKLSTDYGTVSGQVRTDPASSRSITADSDSGDVTVAYR